MGTKIDLLSLEKDEQFSGLIRLILDMAQERNVERLYQKIVDTGASFPNVALVRIYLLGPGDICDNCPQRAYCPDQTQCLHLVASGGTSLQKPKTKQPKLEEDPFRRIPLGINQIGQAAREKQILIVRKKKNQEWIPDEVWAEEEKVRCYVCQPLVYQGNTLGVLTVFHRVEPKEEGMFFGKIVADQLSAAIVNARAFEEIQQLKQHLEWENTYLREDLSAEGFFGQMLGKSPAFFALQQKVDLVAPTDASVLITGETGTGKELVAREIHQRSRRKDEPLIKVNCGAIPPEIYESEFFGHVKGAFTGAFRDRPGRFEAADGGTLFLDEVGEIPPFLQTKLLRVLQEGTYERVGDDQTRHVDVRIIAATNRDLKQEINKGKFRQDLYYRLNVFPIEMPPLRDRKEDIPLLAFKFLEQGCQKMHIPPPKLTKGNMEELQRYHWPGNIRELQNIIERAIIMSQHYKKLHFHLDLERNVAGEEVAADSFQVTSPTELERILTEDEMQELERNNIIAALKKSKGRIRGKGGAADLLGIKATTLAARIKSMGINESQ